MKRCPGGVSKRPLTQVSEKCELQMLELQSDLKVYIQRVNMKDSVLNLHETEVEMLVSFATVGGLFSTVHLV